MRHLFADSAEHIVLIPSPVLACLGSHRDRGSGFLLAPLRPGGIRALLGVALTESGQGFCSSDRVEETPPSCGRQSASQGPGAFACLGNMCREGLGEKLGGRCATKGRQAWTTVGPGVS